MWFSPHGIPRLLAHQRLFGNLVGVLRSRRSGARNKRMLGEIAAISRYISETVQASANVTNTIEREYEVICDLSYSVTSNDLE